MQSTLLSKDQTYMIGLTVPLQALRVNFELYLIHNRLPITFLTDLLTHNRWLKMSNSGLTRLQGILLPEKLFITWISLLLKSKVFLVKTSASISGVLHI